MKQITLNIKDSKFKFFLELIKNFDFVQVEENEGDAKEAILANIKQGLEEVKLVQEGKMKSRPAKELLDEL
jgi:hypothetical protein